MIQLSGKQLLNLQEQVQKNKIDIELWKRVSNLGVKVIGKVATPEELPNPETTPGLSYGEAFLVGEVNDYDVYIFTRPFEEGEPVQWLNVGEIGMKGDTGEQGPAGPEGPRGLRGSQWTVDTVNPTSPYGAEENDSWLNTTTGEVFKFDGFRWNRAGNISGGVGPVGPRGPEGPQGPVGPQGVKGDTGDVGGFIKVIGILSNTDQLPTPASLGDLTKAYLIGAVKPYHLWIQIGATSATATWNDMGELNNGTLVSVNGQNQNTWDADSKVDKITAETVYTQVYAKYANGTQTMLNIVMPEYAVNSAGLVYRDSDGHIRVSDPSNDLDAVNKRYAPVKFAEEERLKSINLYPKANDNISLTAGTTKWNVISNATLKSYGLVSGKTYYIQAFDLPSGIVAQILPYYTGFSTVQRSFVMTDELSLRYGHDNQMDAITFNRKTVISETPFTEFTLYNGPIVHTNDIEPVLLWTNSSPTASINTGTVVQASKSFKYLVIEFSYDNSSGRNNNCQYIKIENITGKYVFMNCTRNGITNSRVAEIIVEGVRFGSGFVGTSENNVGIIPLKVYGTNIL